LKPAGPYKTHGTLRTLVSNLVETPHGQELFDERDDVFQSRQRLDSEYFISSANNPISFPNMPNQDIQGPYNSTLQSPFFTFSEASAPYKSQISGLSTSNSGINFERP
jgi:hypothetical protein